jgi:peptidoglycan hydrolase-like protein with peptidoglycan-binding domain
MTQLTDIEIAEYALGAHFGAAQAVIAVAVALAESQGKNDATNTAGNHPPSEDRGLWQINNYWHPEVSDAQAFDPASAAAAAYRISGQGMDWNAWTTYTSGTFRLYLQRAHAAVVAAVGAFVLRRYLRLVSPYLFGIDVTSLQHQLNKWAPSSLEPLIVDGVYGPLTAAMVGRFQTVHQLAADDVVGPLTARALGWTWAG